MRPVRADWAVSFEPTQRYFARRRRDRFDGALLLTYLTELGVPIEDEAYEEASLHQQRVTWERREVTLAEARADFA